MRKKFFAAAAAAIILCAGLWYFASPSLAMAGLRDAALEGDRTALSERVDFPAVRESLKSQLRAAMMSELAKKKNEQDGFAALGSMIAMGMVNQLVDGLITPDGLKAMMAQGRLAKGGGGGDKPATQPDWTIKRIGLSSFRAMPEAKPGEQVPTLTFRRDGFGWKLVDIEVPTDGLKSSS